MIERIEPVAGQAKIAESMTVPIGTLELWDKNPRSIKTERFQELKNRLRRQGQIKPILVAADGRTVIGGNMRLRAMRELGIDEVWVSLTEAKTDKEIFDLALTDNEEFGYYEQEQVAELALELGLSPLELKSYALSLGEPTTLDLVIDKFGPEVEEDEVPEVDETVEPESKLGEVYQLGKHRLMCGSSTDYEQLNELMNGEKAELLFTDPPYNTGIQQGRTASEWGIIENDKMSANDFDEFITEVIQNAYTFTTGAKYVCIDWKGFTAVYNAMPNVSTTIVWVKNVFGLGSGYRPQHELILFDGKLSANDQSNVWEIKKDGANTYEHPTQKPVAISAKAIKNSSKAGDNVLDLFGGSGSTLIACEQTNRICYMMELDPKYCDVIRKRYANYIGEGDNWQEVTPAITDRELVHASR